MHKLSSIKGSSKIMNPQPTDFDSFLPWACKEYHIDTDVVITRKVLPTYVTAAATTLPKKSSIKSKSRTRPYLVSSVAGTSERTFSSLSDITVFNNANKINIETFYDNNDNLVQLKFLNNKAIPRKVMQVIALTLPHQTYLTSITINSGLRMDSIHEIYKFLPDSNITELCLDSTYLSEINYETLLTNDKLKHLSMAKCTIQDADVKTIADQLGAPCPASRVLSALNLSSNRITDIGAKYLADALRTNRQLSYLNIANNMVTDEGGMSILDTLQTFPPLASEVLESRARHVTYLKERNDLIAAIFVELQMTKLDKNTKKSTRKGKGDRQSLQSPYSQKRLHESEIEAQIIREKAEYLADDRMGLFDEAFSPHNTATQNGVVHCFGNNTLCYLNLAHNSLTYASVKKLHEVLSAQKSLNRTPRGLIKIVIDGNLLPVACEEYEEINLLLKLAIDAIKKQSDFAAKSKTSVKFGAK